MAAPKVTTLGKQAKSAVPESLFGEDFHESLVHDAARAEANARRRGTSSSLSRGQVAMTGQKAWRQKGTGRARVGALSTPNRRGGGAAFGPKPRGYTFKVNRKARRKALRSALSVHAQRDSLAVLDTGAFSEPSTKTASETLGKWGAKVPTLLVVAGDDEAGVIKSFRNLPTVSVVDAASVGVADVIGHRSLVLTQGALEALEERCGEVKRTAAEPSAGSVPSATNEESTAAVSEGTDPSETEDPDA
jgi:large subunit ribosomal protein L4